MYWYVLCVKPKNEIKISRELSEAGFRVYCPTITTIKQWSDRKKKMIVPLLNTYIFIKINDKDRSTVFMVPGINKYLFYLGEPAKVRDAEINTLEEYLTGKSFKSNIEKINIGDDHLITEGPFKGKNGIVSEVGKNRLQVVLKELGMKITFSNEN